MWNVLECVPKNVEVLVYGPAESAYEGYVCKCITIAKAKYDGREWRIYECIGPELRPENIKKWINIPEK